MSWNELNSKQTVSGKNLLDAVNMGIFRLKVQQVIPYNDKCLTANQINSLIDVYPLYDGNKLVRKEQIVAIDPGNPGLERPEMIM